MALYRMRQRRDVLGVLGASIGVREALIALAGQHRETILALHTHTQPAQPSTVAHYLLAIIEQLERDAVRLRAAFDVTNRNPLGACAITGTGFPIDRELTSRLLGFSGPTGNTYGSIATVDYLLQNVTATAVLLAGLGRFVQDMLLWCTAEFALPAPRRRLRAGQQHHAAEAEPRGAGARPRDRQQGPRRGHGRPRGGPQHAVRRHRRHRGRPAAAGRPDVPRRDPGDRRWWRRPWRGAEFDAAHLERRAGEGWITITELADTLVRDHGLAFDTAHGVARRVVEARAEDPSASLSAAVAEATRRTPWRTDPMRRIERCRSCSARGTSSRSRTTHGGPAPAETARGARCVTVGAGRRPCVAGEDPGRPRVGRRRAASQERRPMSDTPPVAGEPVAERNNARLYAGVIVVESSSSTGSAVASGLRIVSRPD